MIPLITSGVTCSPGALVSNVHAGCSFATFAGVICFSGEKRWPPASWSWERHSVVSDAGGCGAAKDTTSDADEDTKAAKSANTKVPKAADVTALCVLRVSAATLCVLVGVVAFRM